MLAFSATYTPDLLADLEPLTRRAQKVLLCEETVSLRGIRQFYKLVHEGAQQEHRGASAAGEDPLPADAWEAEQQRLLTLKVEALLQLLSGVSFHQVRGERLLATLFGWLGQWVGRAFRVGWCSATGSQSARARSANRRILTANCLAY